MIEIKKIKISDHKNTQNWVSIDVPGSLLKTILWRLKLKFVKSNLRFVEQIKKSGHPGLFDVGR